MPKLLRSAAVPVLGLLLAFTPGSGASAAAFEAQPPRVAKRDITPNAASKPKWGELVVRNSTFREMLRGSQARGCEAKTPPVPLATPNPVLDSMENLQFTVSFVVGTDGRVYSALILEGGKQEQGRPLLEAVRRWRFRPAVCNGAPAEAEAKVEFSTPPNRF
jgi:TonB family protein